MGFRTDTTRDGHFTMHHEWDTDTHGFAWVGHEVVGVLEIINGAKKGLRQLLICVHTALNGVRGRDSLFLGTPDDNRDWIWLDNVPPTIERQVRAGALKAGDEARWYATRYRLLSPAMVGEVLGGRVARHTRSKHVDHL